MIKVITSGTVGVRVNGRLVPKTCADGAFSTDSDVETMLVNDGIAAFVDEDDCEADIEPETADDADETADIEPEAADAEASEDVTDAAEAEATTAENAPKNGRNGEKTTKNTGSRRKTEPKSADGGEDVAPPKIDAAGVVE